MMGATVIDAAAADTTSAPILVPRSPELHFDVAVDILPDRTTSDGSDRVPMSLNVSFWGILSPLSSRSLTAKGEDPVVALNVRLPDNE
jgi:hypothetical protein